MDSLVAACLVWAIGSGAVLAEVAMLEHFRCDTVEGVITRSGLTLDPAVSEENKSSLRLTADEPTVFRLLEIKGTGIDNARLIYRATLKTRDLKGRAYLEMWCYLPGKGAYFSRGFNQALMGANDWTIEEISFFLRKGDKPELVKLNLVVNGTGTVWVDDIKLLQGPIDRT